MVARCGESGEMQGLRREELAAFAKNGTRFWT